MDLRGRNEVHDDIEPVQDLENVREEAVRDGFAVRVDVEHGYGGFDGYRCRVPGESGKVRLGGSRSREIRGGSVCFRGRIAVDVGWGCDDGSAARWVEGVFDTDGDRRADNLFHCEGVDDFAAVVGQFRGLVRGDEGQQAGEWGFARVGGEDAVDFFEDVEFAGGCGDGEEGGGEVGVAAADGCEDGAGDGAEVACLRGREPKKSGRSIAGSSKSRKPSPVPKREGAREVSRDSVNLASLRSASLAIPPVTTGTLHPSTPVADFPAHSPTTLSSHAPSIHSPNLPAR